MPDYNINLTIQNIWYVFRIVLDIGIMWFILYYAIKFVRNNNRTIQIFKGIVAVLIFNGIARLLGLSTVEYFSNLLISWGFLAIIIIFQPEIRSMLERIGKTNAFSRITTLLANEKEDLVNQIYEATITLSKEKVGALISIEQSSSLQDYIKTGIAVNAAVSKELLCSIFMTTTPLHDGAVIIQGDKIACASAYFPPTSINLSSRYGARHRAGLGISEVTDALTIVVSEETSAISIAENGRIFTVDEIQLKDYLRRVICNDEIEIGNYSRSRSSLKIEDDPEMLIKNKKNSDMKVPVNNRSKSEGKAKAKEEKTPAVGADTLNYKVESIKVNEKGDTKHERK
ncbi:MAG: diadenylate cyclase CdaA [Erysipelotrichaceae bacterium]|nr:diadenylate cyclase CdaA [Erysipelotrichaceae bacterium]